LKQPEISLQTNGSEGDIFDHVRKRMLSGQTRSEKVRQCRALQSKKTAGSWEFHLMYVVILDNTSAAD